MKALNDLYMELVDLYGYEVEICGALARWHDYLEYTHKKTGLTELPFARNDPVSPKSSYQYIKSFSELINSSKKGGRHTNTHRRSVIVLTYAIWEDEFRQKIAKECGKTCKNGIESEVFRDLNMYRRGVLHAGGKLAGNPKIINFFKNGNKIILTDYHMYRLFSILVSELNRIGQIYYAREPGFSLDKPFGHLLKKRPQREP